jgi:hypothetical protein
LSTRLRGDTNASLHHNVFAHFKMRGPQLTPKGANPPRNLVLNNVVYDYWESGTRLGSGKAELNPDADGYYDIIANYYKQPTLLVEGKAAFEINVEKGLAGATAKSIVFVQGNYGPHRTASSIDDWALVQNEDAGSGRIVRASARFSTDVSITASTAEEAFPLVLRGAGATVPKRDSVDERVIADVKNGTGHVIDSQNDVGGWPSLEPGVAPVDADHDGMADEWERAHGLDPADAADGARDRNADGYTNVEEYLDSLVPRAPLAGT